MRNLISDKSKMLYCFVVLDGKTASIAVILCNADIRIINSNTICLVCFVYL